MSTAFNAYLVSLPEIRSFFGCRDPLRLKKVHEFIAGDDDFDDAPGWDQSRAKLERAINSLAMGIVTDIDDIHARLAMLALSKTYGTEQDSDLLCDVRVEILNHLGQGAEPLFCRGFPAPYESLPFDLKFGMFIGYLENREVPPLLEELETLLENLDDETVYLHDTILTVIGWYEGAIEEQRDLIGFGN